MEKREREKKREYLRFYIISFPVIIVNDSEIIKLCTFTRKVYIFFSLLIKTII